MKREVLISLIFLLVISGLVSAVTCTDTDVNTKYLDGRNFFEKGTVSSTIGNITETDECIDFQSGLEAGYDLKERYCNDIPENGQIGLASTMMYDCPNGCENGACKEESKITCVDTDGGKNYYLSGVAKTYEEGVSYPIDSSGESCITNTNKVLESYCEDGNSHVMQEEYECPNGCENGACIDIGDGEPYPSVELLEPTIFNLAVKQNGVTYPICSDLDKKWCKDENPNAEGDGPFEFDWDDKSVSCSWFPATHTYSNGGDYLIKVRVKNTCGFVSERSSQISIREKKPLEKSCSIGEVRCSPVYNAYDWCQEYDGKIQWLLKEYCKDNEICNKGICVPAGEADRCEDSDGGKNYYQRGVAKSYAGDNQWATDSAGESCISNTNKVLESYCDEEYKIMQEEYECPYGCKDGACIKIEPTEPVDINGTISACSGCVLDKKCYPFGYRVDGKYCFASNLEFIEQKEAGASCDNNFECDSNVCVDDECISAGLLRKIINWFKRMFGGE